MAEDLNYYVSPALESAVMTEVALHEGEFGVTALSRHMALPTGTVSRTARFLEQKNWLEVRRYDIYPPRGGHPIRLLFSTKVFEEAWRRAMQQVEYLPAEDKLLFEDGAAAYEVPQDRSRVAYPGATGVLGERYNLHVITEGEWFEGAAGWQSLMALRDRFAASEAGG